MTWLPSINKAFISIITVTRTSLRRQQDEQADINWTDKKWG